MFSVIFPGQGSQSVGMAKDLYDKFNTLKELFLRADDVLKFPISKLILDGPSEKLNETENTQPAIFLVGFSIFQLIKKDFGIDLNKANYFAGHSLGEYTALACAEVLSFSETLNLLKKRGKSMQDAVPIGKGGMAAILGSTPDQIEKIINESEKKYECYIANDNSNGQQVVSGTLADIDLLMTDLKKKIILKV
jgi:[acyl-carrier-protein] S-malonyltransferase